MHSVASSNLAPRSLRVVGHLIDGVIIVVPIVAATFLLAFNETIGILALIVTACFGFGYYLFADAMRGGQSFGKRVVDTAVIHAETGRPCSAGESFMRNFLLYLLGPIDWLFIFGERRQRLGDKLAGTIVIEAPGGAGNR